MTAVATEVVEWINSEIKRHKQWRQIWSFLYFAIAASTVIAGALTTASAGIFDDAATNTTYTTWLAAATTIFASLEKVLRLREKWDLHRNIQVMLEMIKMRSAAGLIDNKEVMQQVEQAAQLYSSQLSELTAPTNGVGDQVPAN